LSFRRAVLRIKKPAGAVDWRATRLDAFTFATITPWLLRRSCELADPQPPTAMEL